MLGREALREGAGLRVDDEVDVALAIERDVLRAVFRDHAEAHDLEQAIQRLRIGMAELHELEAVGSHGVLFGYGGWRRIVRERSHGQSPFRQPLYTRNGQPVAIPLP